jgi:hypothetical protein
MEIFSSFSKLVDNLLLREDCRGENYVTISAKTTFLLELYLYYLRIPYKLCVLDKVSMYSYTPIY